MLSMKFVLLCVLLCALLVSALAVIISKYESRLLFIAIQTQEKQLDHYELEWGQLQLELTMLTAENRLETIALKDLGMVMPDRKNIVYLKP